MYLLLPKILKSSRLQETNRELGWISFNLKRLLPVGSYIMNFIKRGTMLEFTQNQLDKLLRRSKMYEIAEMQETSAPYFSTSCHSVKMNNKFVSLVNPSKISKKSPPTTPCLWYSLCDTKKNRSKYLPLDFLCKVPCGRDKKGDDQKGALTIKGWISDSKW